MKLSERLQGLKEEVSKEITLSPDLEDAMDRCVEAARHLESKVEEFSKRENNIIDDGISESLFDKSFEE